MCDFLRGKLVKLLTLLLSAFRSTAREATSEWERSCVARALAMEGGGKGLRTKPGDGEGDDAEEDVASDCSGGGMGKTEASDGIEPQVASGGRGAWYGRVLDGSLSASILRTDCGLAAPETKNILSVFCWFLFVLYINFKEKYIF